MLRDREEIESVLKEGERILSERPELADMSIHDMLNELDDGTQQMIHNRWGVAAWLVIKSIKSFELQMLVEQLSEVDSGILTYEYAGYLLQAKYKINLAELILEADQCGKFDKIVLYVTENFIYEEELYEQYIPKMLNMMEKHKDYNHYHAFLMNYAKLIVGVGAQHLAEEMLGDLDGQVQYDFMRDMRWEWYQKDAVEADEVIGRMLGRGSVWSKKTAIDFLESSLNYGKVAFRRYFPQVESLILESEELWQMLIPVFVKYVMRVCTENGVDSEQINHRVLEYLEKISDSTLKVKCSFVEAIQWTEDIPEELKKVFQTIISHSFDRDKCMLDMLDSHLYGQLRKGRWKAVLQVMLEVFTANKYLANYQEFFDIMNSVKSGLSKYSAEVTAEALDYMLSGGVERFFFGLGLLKEVGDLRKLRNGRDDANFSFTVTFDDTQMLRLMKGILYYIADSKRICHMAFQLLEFSGKSRDIYMKFCMKEVYENYPATMYEVAENYKSVEDEKQGYVARQVIEMHERLLNERESSYRIRDLQISKEHQYIYHRAVQEQNRMINKQANEKSVFAQFFSRSTLKYGMRNAYVTIGRKDEKFYQVNPYVQHGYRVEIPTVYVNDPVDFELTRRTYLEEVIRDAASDKGLSTSIERER